MRQLCEELLRTWCDSLLRLQIRNTGNPRLDGGILCPACGRIHGRCFEAMYPFLYMASVTGDDVWCEAAAQLFSWADHVVSQADGSFLNDIDSQWKGTTVFNVIALADCLSLQHEIVPERTKQRWWNRLGRAADFLYGFEELNENNINYPVSNALAMYKCGMVLGDDRYLKRAEQMAAFAAAAMNEDGLLFGEGVPRERRSGRGCRPFDLGYNVEETLPALALYAYLSKDEAAAEIAERGLIKHLEFMAEDGGWDNSFGTRNYKWTYWGSRTSDGCGLGYLLFADRHPAFGPAVRRNLDLMRACTADGLLAGGPHYQAAGQLVCVHHTFTHAKVLAEILERGLWVEADDEIVLPEMAQKGIVYYPEMDTWRVRCGAMTATVTAYDWEYLPGGHVSGGTLSFLHHRRAGTLLCAGMGEYTLKEPGNMQIPVGVRQECLALRAEVRLGAVLYSSIYEDCAEVSVKDGVITVHGELKDISHQKAPDRTLSYLFSFMFNQNEVRVRAQLAQGILICPLISRADEAIAVLEDSRTVRIDKGQAVLEFAATAVMRQPYGQERIFNLVPGFQALRIDLMPEQQAIEFSIIEFSISVTDK